MQQKSNDDAILGRGRRLLDAGDIKGYWDLMSRHSAYARLAGDVFERDGALAHIAHRRMQRVARKTLGRELSKNELAEIGRDIAHADWRTRRSNLERKGHIGVTGKDTAVYHREVFRGHGLPPETYTPYHLQGLVGSYWSKAVGRPTADATDMDFADAYAAIEDSYRKDPEAFKRDLGGAASDAWFATNDIADYVGDDRRMTQPWGVGHDPLEKTKRPDATSPAKPADRPDRDPGKASPRPESGRRTSDPPPAAGGLAAEAAATAAAMGDGGAAEAPGRPTARAQVERVLPGLLSAEDGIEEILLKPPAAWTEDELRAVRDDRARRPGHDPERTPIAEAEAAWFRHVYGDRPVRRDAAGRLRDPAPVVPPAKTPATAATPDGGGLADGLLTIGARIAEIAGAADVKGAGKAAAAITALQAGLNLLAGADRAQAPAKMTPGKAISGTATPPGVDAGAAAVRALPVRPLAEDGVFGPKTRRALRRAVAGHGAGRVEDGLALGRFLDFARDARRTGRTSGLAAATDGIFGPLFGRAGIPRAEPEDKGLWAREPAKPRPALPQPRIMPPPRRDDAPAPRTPLPFNPGTEINRLPLPDYPGGSGKRMPLPDYGETPEPAALQDTLNDLGSELFGPRTWTPLTVDGRIGRRTEDAFGRVVRRAGPERLIRRYGSFLGML